ncbi:MAG: phosphogluconate dehydrogenase (NAD(+)-dependent, decarboxylating) [Patescibacteria group bacterium]
MRIGFIGLGKMGGRMVVKLLQEQHELVVWNRSQKPLEELRIRNQESRREKNHNSKFIIHDSTIGNLEIAKTIEELAKLLKTPRIVWVMVTAGVATQKILDELVKFVEKGDIVIDGGNSYYKDTEKRFKDFRTKGIKFLGIGVSGGIIAGKEGYPLMVGGDKSAYEFVKPILDSLSKPNGGHEYFGEGGSGHFVKMVHNGIEYGIMQSLGEGFGVLEKAPYRFDLEKISKLWQRGTLVSGFMLDRAVEVFSKPSILDSIDGYIEESGEAGWMVEEAKEMGSPIEIIEKSLEFRKKSQKDKSIQNSFAAKLIASLRQAFGGHEVKKRFTFSAKATK